MIKLLSAAVASLIMCYICRSDQSRLFAVVGVGAALVAIISINFYQGLSSTWYSDPARLSAQVVSALGFIGSGLIWFAEDKTVKGVSAASGLWFTAIGGLLIGAGLGNATVGAVFFIMVLLLVDRMTNWEEIVQKRVRRDREY